MSDKGTELLRQALGESEQAPLTDMERQTAKKAAIFAVVSFLPNFAQDEWFKKINPGLTDEQINFAKHFSEVFPKPEDVLPKSELNAAISGFNTVVATGILEAVPIMVENDMDPQQSSDNSKKDLTGVTTIRQQLQEKEEEANISRAELEGKEEEVRAKIAAIFYASKDIPDEPPPSKPLDDQDEGENFVNSVLKAFSGGDRNQRKSFITNARYSLHQEQPMEIGQDGKLIPSAALEVLGARLAFEHYQTAVNMFMNRWG